MNVHDTITILHFYHDFLALHSESVGFFDYGNPFVKTAQERPLNQPSKNSFGMHLTLPLQPRFSVLIAI